MTDNIDSHTGYLAQAYRKAIRDANYYRLAFEYLYRDDLCIRDQEQGDLLHETLPRAKRFLTFSEDERNG